MSLIVAYQSIDRTATIIVYKAGLTHIGGCWQIPCTEREKCNCTCPKNYLRKQVHRVRLVCQIRKTLISMLDNRERANADDIYGEFLRK